LQKHAMPFANGVVIQKQGLGNFLATPAGVEKHQRIGPPCQPVLHRTIPRQGDQVGAVLRRQKSSAHHATDKNRKIAQWQEIFRTFNDSGYKSDCNHQHPLPLTFWQSILSELQDWLAVNLHFPKTAWCNRIQVSGGHISQTVCFYSEFEYGTNQWAREGGVNTCILLAIIKTHAAIAGCH